MVAELVKGIKPKKLRVDKIRLNLLNALRAEGKIIEREFEKTTRTWQGEKPKFETLIGLTGQDATVIVGPAGSQHAVDKWVWADEGTRAHIIRAKRVPNLIFRTGYKAKTKVGSFSSGAGGSFGPFRRKKQVRHPGTRARGWSVLIVKRRKKPFTKSILKAARVVT